MGPFTRDVLPRLVRFSVEWTSTDIPYCKLPFCICQLEIAKNLWIFSGMNQLCVAGLLRICFLLFHNAAR